MSPETISPMFLMSVFIGPLTLPSPTGERGVTC
jgi:hypothetical protein